MAEGRESSFVGWVMRGVAAVAGLFGAVNFSDAYQAISFLVLILTAINLVVNINKQLRNKGNNG